MNQQNESWNTSKGHQQDLKAKENQKNTKQQLSKKLKDLKTKHKRNPKQLTNNI